jgi:hypothetical protein
LTLVVVIMCVQPFGVNAGSPPSDADPPLDFLEFLGTWETTDGREINPFDLDDDLDELPTGRTGGRSQETRQQTGDAVKDEPIPGKNSRLRGLDRQPEGRGR